MTPSNQYAIVRDRCNRRRLLDALVRSRNNEFSGWVSAKFLAEVIQFGVAQMDRVPNDENLMALLRDLVLADYAVERDDREYKTQPFTLETLSYRATSKGVSLYAEAIPVDPMVEDPRIG